MNIIKIVNRIIVTDKKCSIDPVKTTANKKVAMFCKAKSKLPTGLDRMLLPTKIVNIQLLQNSKIFRVLLGTDFSLSSIQNLTNLKLVAKKFQIP